MADYYMSFSDVAKYLGINSGALSHYKLPEPDVYVGKTRGWAKTTIEQWDASRPGKGGRPAKK